MVNIYVVSKFSTALLCVQICDFGPSWYCEHFFKASCYDCIFLQRGFYFHVNHITGGSSHKWSILCICHANFMCSATFQQLFFSKCDFKPPQIKWANSLPTSLLMLPAMIAQLYKNVVFMLRCKLFKATVILICQCKSIHSVDYNFQVPIS